MRRRRFLTYSLYFLFALFILMAFIISRKIVEKQDENVPWKEDFTILRSGEEISALYYDGENVWVGLMLIASASCSWVILLSIRALPIKETQNIMGG